MCRNPEVYTCLALGVETTGSAALGVGSCPGEGSLIAYDH
jgi:hypothetical protein